MDRIDVVEFAAWSVALLITIAATVLYVRLWSLGPRAGRYAAFAILMGAEGAIACFIASALVCRIFWGRNLGLDRLDSPPWPARIEAASIVVGGIAGVAVAFWNAYRKERACFRRITQEAEDYDDGTDGLFVSPREQ
jgi:hypothetical protein